MGYFSEYDICARSYRRDHSLERDPSEILLERLDLLQDRLEILLARPGRYEDRICLTDGEIREILPEHLESVNDVRKAICLVKTDLSERYGIRLEQEPPAEAPIVDEITPWQLSFAA